MKMKPDSIRPDEKVHSFVCECVVASIGAKGELG